MPKKHLSLLITFAAVAGVLVLAGCGDRAAAPPPAAQATPAPAPAPEAPAAAAPAPEAAAAPAAGTDEASLQAILATADAADGTTDQVVSKCAGCRLGMDGNAAHSVQAHGYTLHFCSETCKATSEPKIDAVIAALK